MAYTVINFKTKKQLKEAVAEWKANLDVSGNAIYSDKGKPVRCFQPGLGPDLSNYSGKVCLEGPHGFHKWYAEAELINGIVVKVS